MAEAGLIDDAPPVRGRGRLALRIGLIYLAARVVTTGFLLLAASLSGFDSRFGVDPSLFTLVGGWDAQWYQYLVLTGYPGDLPVDASGAVAQNAWAFMPVFAYLAGAVGLPFGSWVVGGFLVAFVAGYLCCLVLHDLLRPRLDETAATWSVVFFASAPLAAMFQLAYAETLFLLWVLLALLCIRERRYGWVYALVLLIAYTRPGVLAFALFLGLVLVWRWMRRGTEPFAVRDGVHIVALGILASAAGFSWPLIAGAVTGDANAYLATELAWRRGFGAGEHGFLPFAGWFEGAGFWLETWGWGPVAGILVGAAVIAAAGAILLWEPHVRRLGPEVRLWAASYLVYLFAVVFPQSSLFRLLFPLAPLWGAFGQVRSWWGRGIVLALCLTGQWWWIWNMYGLGNQYWQVP